MGSYRLSQLNFTVKTYFFLGMKCVQRRTAKMVMVTQGRFERALRRKDSEETWSFGKACGVQRASPGKNEPDLLMFQISHIAVVCNVQAWRQGVVRCSPMENKGKGICTFLQKRSYSRAQKLCF